LTRIFKTCPGIDCLLGPDDPLPDFDVQASLTSLPALFKTTVATVPASIPYLAADPALTERYRRGLERYPEFKIGIVWQANARPECRAMGRRKSFPLSYFEPLSRLPGVKLFSLQKGYGREQLAQWQIPFGIVDLADRLSDFMETAAVMMNLDLIISADTAPVHLAGALGRKVWTILPFAGCWRWLHADDTPWYPTMRLFRSQKPEDWGGVFEFIAEEVRKLISRSV
jgi:hypothetical protein